MALPEPDVEVEAPPDREASPDEAAPPPDAAPEDPIAAGHILYSEATAAQRERSRTELQDRITAYLNKATARVVVTDNLQTMLSVKRGQGEGKRVLTFRLHHMFIGAPAAVVRAVARYAQTHDRKAATLLRDYADANEALIRRRESPRPVTIDTEGRHHNLQEIFDELNDKYFDGNIRARITWGRRSRRSRSRSEIGLGRYVFDDELIRVHPVLDAADVPRYFVEWIVFHEMLHEVHGMPEIDGRRVHHPPEFLRDEQKFERYVDAVMWERVHARKLLDR